MPASAAQPFESCRPAPAALLRLVVDGRLAVPPRSLTRSSPVDPLRRLWSTSRGTEVR